MGSRSTVQSSFVFSTYLSIVLVLIVAFGAALVQADALRDFCKSKGGKMIRSWTCPASGKVRVGAQCKITNRRGQTFIFDGCSGGGDKYGEIFFKACVLHDLCYHNEPKTSGRARVDCDNRLYADTMEICETVSDEERGSCEGAAQAFYAAVRVFGRPAWRCSNDSASYPASMLEL